MRIETQIESRVPSADALTALQLLRDWVEQRDYAGYDPYDALNSPVLRAASLGRRWGRIACIQAMRRSPLNLRPVLFGRPGHNPKALALFLMGYSRIWRLMADPAIRVQCERLLDLLDKTRSTSCAGHGWGYNFDWQSRAFFVPKGTPSIVCSSFVGHALLDAWEAFRDRRALALALPVADFILRDLRRFADPSGDFCFSYTPLDEYGVHNANVLGASILIRIARITGDVETRRTAERAIGYTVKRQRPDGSWPYAERAGSGWVDSFHTGFILEGLRQFCALCDKSIEAAAYRRGVLFYSERMFLADGTPKYYVHRVRPIDVHCAAEAIAFFAGEQRHRELSTRILSWTLANMWDPEGFFYFRRYAFGVNRIAYMRWSEAWMFRALAEYCAPLA